MNPEQIADTVVMTTCADVLATGTNQPWGEGWEIACTLPKGHDGPHRAEDLAHFVWWERKGAQSDGSLCDS